MDQLTATLLTFPLVSKPMSSRTPNRLKLDSETGQQYITAVALVETEPEIIEQKPAFEEVPALEPSQGTVRDEIKNSEEYEENREEENNEEGYEEYVNLNFTDRAPKDKPPADTPVQQKKITKKTTALTNENLFEGAQLEVEMDGFNPEQYLRFERQQTNQDYSSKGLQQEQDELFGSKQKKQRKGRQSEAGDESSTTRKLLRELSETDW